MPTSALAFTANYRISDSGRITPFYSTPSSGLQDLVSVPSYGGKSITKMLGMRFAPSNRFTIDANLNNMLTEGDNTTNTTTNGTDFGLTLNPWDWMQFMGHISLQDMNYIGAAGTVGSKIGFFRLQIGPLQDFTLDLNYQRMISTSTATDDYGGWKQGDNMDVNMDSFIAELRRPIGHGRTAFIQYQASQSTGYQADIKNIASLGVDFPVTKVIGLTFDWRITDYSNLKDATKNYNANSLNVELGARFH
jgi:hypothetical protein